ncbi:MAG: BNR-4 repeat-containing protein [Planctomycetes bacterium]|nr:BNR-4 repeat-containing protein [Planctomycetota bacterium]
MRRRNTFRTVAIGWTALAWLGGGSFAAEPQPPPAPWTTRPEKSVAPRETDTKADGYRGIWFTLGQYQSEYGDKYSGGLGTYTANHEPIAIYSAKANKTFFVYGGTIKDQRHLLIMAAYYDHKKHVVPRPTIVFDKKGVNDPHDNGSICLDDKGYVWVFISGRGRHRPGFKYRSREPHSVDAFVHVGTEEITYPQPWFVPGRGFLHLFTKYTKGRELYWETSSDGMTWADDRKLAGFGGHYQVTQRRGDLIVSAFNWHPGGSVDKRTNLYVVQTRDFGKTWQTLDGSLPSLPLDSPSNPALVHDYAADRKLVYINDVNFDAQGRPIVQYIVSDGSEPGPKNDPRVWTVARWTGTQWGIHDTGIRSDHNYDMGSLCVEDDGAWRIIGPNEPGPQRYGTGGEMAAWISRDEGRTWTKVATITRGSKYNHSYARRPIDAHPDFYALWADGDAFKLSPSHLYITNRACDKVWVLPETMTGEFAEPVLLPR